MLDALQSLNEAGRDRNTQRCAAGMREPAPHQRWQEAQKNVERPDCTMR